MMKVMKEPPLKMFAAVAAGLIAPAALAMRADAPAFEPFQPGTYAYREVANEDENLKQKQQLRLHAHQLLALQEQPDDFSAPSYDLSQSQPWTWVAVAPPHRVYYPGEPQPPTRTPPLAFQMYYPAPISMPQQEELEQHQRYNVTDAVKEEESAPTDFHLKTLSQKVAQIAAAAKAAEHQEGFEVERDAAARDEQGDGGAGVRISPGSSMWEQRRRRQLHASGPGSWDTKSAGRRGAGGRGLSRGSYNYQELQHIQRHRRGAGPAPAQTHQMTGPLGAEGGGQDQGRQGDFVSAPTFKDLRRNGISLGWKDPSNSSKQFFHRGQQEQCTGDWDRNRDGFAQAGRTSRDQPTPSCKGGPDARYLLNVKECNRNGNVAFSHGQKSSDTVTSNGTVVGTAADAVDFPDDERTPAPAVSSGGSPSTAPSKIMKRRRRRWSEMRSSDESSPEAPGEFDEDDEDNRTQIADPETRGKYPQGFSFSSSKLVGEDERRSSHASSNGTTGGSSSPSSSNNVLEAIRKSVAGSANPNVEEKEASTPDGPEEETNMLIEFVDEGHRHQKEKTREAAGVAQMQKHAEERNQIEATGPNSSAFNAKMLRAWPSPCEAATSKAGKKRRNKELSGSMAKLTANMTPRAAAPVAKPKPLWRKKERDQAQAQHDQSRAAVPAATTRSFRYEAAEKTGNGTVAIESAADFAESATGGDMPRVNQQHAGAFSDAHSHSTVNIKYLLRDNPHLRSLFP